MGSAPAHSAVCVGGLNAYEMESSPACVELEVLTEQSVESVI